MRIGVPKEIKNHEYRVGLTPASVRELVDDGNEVLIETGAGAAIGFPDKQYTSKGGVIAASAAEVFERAELIVKVKEPQPGECDMLAVGKVLFTYLHLAADGHLTERLRASGVTAIAYETVTGPDGGLPLLSPMSEVAGRMSVQAGAHYLEKSHGGSGILLGGVPGVAPAHVVILGGGVVGDNAAHMAVGMGARVSILDRSLPRLRALDAEYEGRAQCIFSTASAVEAYALDADLLIGAVLVPGATAPKLLTRDVVRRMRPGSVMVDVAIDQGGCFETSHPTTHADPMFTVDGVVHYCVANMPGGCARTATMALNNATLPFVLKLAALGLEDAIHDDLHLARGVNVMDGRLTHPAVAESLGEPWQAVRGDLFPIP